MNTKKEPHPSRPLTKLNFKFWEKFGRKKKRKNCKCNKWKRSFKRARRKRKEEEGLKTSKTLMIFDPLIILCQNQSKIKIVFTKITGKIKYIKKIALSLNLLACWKFDVKYFVGADFRGRERSTGRFSCWLWCYWEGWFWVGWAGRFWLWESPMKPRRFRCGWVLCWFWTGHIRPSWYTPSKPSINFELWCCLCWNPFPASGYRSTTGCNCKKTTPPPTGLLLFCLITLFYWKLYTPFRKCFFAPSLSTNKYLLRTLETTAHLDLCCKFWL